MKIFFASEERGLWGLAFYLRTVAQARLRRGWGGGLGEVTAPRITERTSPAVKALPVIVQEATMNDNGDMRPLALTPRDAARALSMSEKALWNLTQPRGPIPAAKIGRLVRYDIRDLLAFLDAMKAAAVKSETRQHQRAKKNRHEA